jgi:hypothetical protein
MIGVIRIAVAILRAIKVCFSGVPTSAPSEGPHLGTGRPRALLGPIVIAHRPPAFPLALQRLQTQLRLLAVLARSPERSPRVGPLRPAARRVSAPATPLHGGVWVCTC